ncbi:MAG: hypothetical protein GX306_05260 [Clostridiales bacterium]|nr:hypothetical protein [Clostridiales bacterium]
MKTHGRFAARRRVKSLWLQYRKRAAFSEVTCRHPELHKDVIIKRSAVRERRNTVKTRNIGRNNKFIKGGIV